MHRVDDLDALADVLRSAQREAASSFGDGTLFIERYLEHARHVEVQVFADQHGGVVHLGTRDCSLQRRHQKIVEEAPAPSIAADVLERMCAASVALARRIDYVGAGTVEFLAFGDEYAFLEMNTRLQVEHPVTELVTSLDLVDLQISVAQGDPLPFDQDDVNLSGHAIEARLYAEDPTADFLPSPGSVTLFDAAAGDGVRWEVGVETGSSVSSRYDPMIAKVSARGRDRDEARHRLARALTLLRIGGVRTNRDMLVAILDDPDFAACQLDTHFLDDRPHLAQSVATPALEAHHVAAAVLHTVLQQHAGARIQRFAPPGWRNLRSQDAALDILVDGQAQTITYRPGRWSDRWTLVIDGQTHQARVVSCDATTLDVELGSARATCRVTSLGRGMLLVSSTSGQSTIELCSDDADDGPASRGGLTSPLPGTVVLISAAAGDTVREGDTLVVVEAMKMEHRITAPRDGVVESIHVAVGDVVEHDALVAALQEEKA